MEFPGDLEGDLQLVETCLVLADVALACPEKGLLKAIDLLSKATQLLEFHVSTRQDERLSVLLLRSHQKLYEMRRRLQ